MPIAHNGLQEDLTQLLLKGAVNTQEEICNALQVKGHEVNQSKVSRLLRKIGAIKSKNAHGQLVYHLPFEPAPPTAQSQLSSLIINVVANETTIIVNTSPGSAQLIARVLDYHKDQANILGTIAGDDAIFVIPKSIEEISFVMVAIKQVLR